MRLAIPLFAMLMVRPSADGGGCNPSSGWRLLVPHDGRIGVAGHANGRGVLVDAIGVGAPADGVVEPGDVIVAIDGFPLSGPGAFEDLRHRARGPRGSSVELSVDGEWGSRTVRLARARVDDHGPRREAPLPSEDELSEALLTATWWCFEADRRVEVHGTLRHGRMEVARIDGAAPLTDCVRDAIESAPAPEGRHGDFVWTVGSMDCGTPVMRTTVLPPGSSR